MKSLYTNKTILKNKLTILSGFCLTLGLLHLQTEEAIGMDIDPQVQKKSQSDQPKKKLESEPRNEPFILPQFGKEKTLAKISKTEKDQPSTQEVSKQQKLVGNMVKEFIVSYQKSQNRSEETSKFITEINSMWERMYASPTQTKHLFINILRQCLSAYVDILAKDDLVKITQHLTQLENQALGITPLNLSKVSGDFPENTTLSVLTEGEIKAGGDRTPVKLVQKTMESKFSEKPQSCFQFIDKSNNPLIFNQKPSPCYTQNNLNTQLLNTEEVYKEAIEQIQLKADRALAMFIKSNDIDPTVVGTLLKNYLDKANNQDEVDTTGASLSTEDKNDIKKYMELCTSIYTDYYTRNLLLDESTKSMTKKLDSVMKRHEEINDLYDTLTRISINYKESLKSTATQKKTSTVKGTVIAEEQVERVRTPEQEKMHYQEQYKSFIETLNIYLSTNHLPTIEDSNINSISTTVEKLEKIKQDIENDYFWYFDKNPESLDQAWLTKAWESAFGNHSIPKYKGRQLTSKAVVSTSFINKAGLDPENIDILDIGFRNQEVFGSILNRFASTVFRLLKSNPISTFDGGEVDYIAYIEKDKNGEKDKIVLAYAGSNSHTDWAIDFTLGSKLFQGISVHEGIGWLFETTIKTYHRILAEKVKNHYEKIQDQDKPKKLEIIVTGHSLGGGLAELAAFYYKLPSNINSLKDSTGIKDIDVKLFTYAAPAIIGKSSAEAFETSLKKNNIYRVWVTNDPVATLTEKLGDGAHVGKSIPLFNIQKAEVNRMDWWGPHAAGRYESLIENLINPTLYQKYHDLLLTLNNYVKTTHLDIYKKNSRDLEMLMELFKEATKEEKPFSFILHQGLATHIMKYTPMMRHLKPPSTVKEFNLDSPRGIAALSPRFVAKGLGAVTDTGNTFDRFEVEATFQLANRRIKFPIHKHTQLKAENIITFLNSPEIKITIPQSEAKTLSCGCYFAQQIFVSQFPEDTSISMGSYYTGTGFASTRTLFSKVLHNDTLTKVLHQSITDGYCSQALLNDLGVGKNLVKLTETILEKVGLDKAFLELNPLFERFEYQDETKRPGIDIKEAYKGEANAFKTETISSMMKTNPTLFDAVKILTDVKVKEIAQLIITASSKKAGSYNAINSLINHEEFLNLLTAENSRGVDPKELYDTFKANLIKMINALYAEQLGAYEKAGMFAKAPLKPDLNILDNRLSEIGIDMVMHASWTIKQEPQENLLGLEGGQQSPQSPLGNSPKQLEEQKQEKR